jgi:hypothetical protein
VEGRQWLISSRQPFGNVELEVGSTSRQVSCCFVM